MASILRFRKLCYLEPVKLQSYEKKVELEKESVFVPKPCFSPEPTKRGRRSGGKEWRCMDNCCWTIGFLCTTWWLCLFLFNCLSATLPEFQVPESPGVRLKREGLTPLHPVVMVPGIVTGGLELWEGKPCAQDLFRKRLWDSDFTEIIKRWRFAELKDKGKDGP